MDSLQICSHPLLSPSRESRSHQNLIHPRPTNLIDVLQPTFFYFPISISHSRFPVFFFFLQNMLIPSYLSIPILSFPLYPDFRSQLPQTRLLTHSPPRSTSIPFAHSLSPLNLRITISFPFLSFSSSLQSCAPSPPPPNPKNEIQIPKSKDDASLPG